MADILASVSVVLGADISDLKGQLAKAKAELRGLVQYGEGLKEIGQSMTLGFTAAFAVIGGKSLKLAGEMEQAEVAFTTMLGSADKAKTTLAGLKQFAADTPFEFPELQDAAKKLLAFNTPAEELQGTLRRLGDISSGIGAPIGEISELFGKARVQGRLFQEDINQLTGRGIPIIQELAKQFGVSDGEVRKLVESGKVGFPNLEKAFTSLTDEGGKFAGLMAAQSQTLPGLYSSLTDTIGQAAAQLGKDLAEAFNLKEVVPRLAATIKSIADSFSALSPEVKRFAILFAGVTAAIGPLLYGVGQLITLLPNLKIAFAALTGPVGLTVLAIAGAAALIIANWDTIKAYFTTGEGAGAFKELQRTVSDVMAELKLLVAEAVAFFRQAWAQFGPVLVAQTQTAFRILKALFTDGFAVLGDILTIFSRLFRGDWAGMWDGLVKLGADALNLLTGVLTAAVSGILNISSKLAGAFKLDGLSKGLASASSSVTTFGASLRLSTGTAKETAAATSTLAESTKALTVAASTAAAAVTGMSEEQKKALDGLRESLRENERLSIALGTSYDFIGGKSKALQSGIESLVKAGFDPAGEVVQGFVAQLRAVPAAYDQLEQRLSKGIAAPKVEVEVAFKTDLPEIKLPTSLPTLDITPFTAPLQEATAQMAQFQAAGELFTQGINDVLRNGLTNVAVSVGEAIGQILINAGGIELVKAALLSGIGSLAIDVGKLAIATGVAISGIKASLETLNPVLAIAGGVALVALGTAVKGAASKLGKGGGGGGALIGASSPASATKTYQPPTPATRKEASAQNNTQVVNLVLSSGQMLSAVQIATDRLGRVVGARQVR